MGTMLMRKPKLPSLNLAAQRIDQNANFMVGDQTWVVVPQTADSAYPATTVVDNGIQIVGYSGLVDVFLLAEWASTTYARYIRLTKNGVEVQAFASAAIDRQVITNVSVNAGDILRLEGQGNSSATYRTIVSSMVVVAKAGELIVPKAAGLTMTVNGTALALSTWQDVVSTFVARTNFPDTVMEGGNKFKIVGGGKRRLNYRIRFGGSGTNVRGGRIMRLRNGTTTVIHTTSSSGSSVIRTATESIQDFNDGDVIWLQGYCDNTTSTSRIPAATSDGVYFTVDDH